jgi:uncharacterized protein YdeI (YjbR/CyaY-like superfamily)
MEAHYFTTQDEFRAWLAEHHATADELLLGFYKKGSGLTGISYAEALDAALGYGWIDGIRRRVDDERYTIRFTPRRPGSIWSDVNTRRAAELEAAGLMAPSGLAAFHGRDKAKAQQYSYERFGGLDEAAEAALRANPAAWAFWEAQPPSYRRPAAQWVMSAKREETRQRRLATLIADSANGLRIKELRRMGR